jgi:hypothetical protein
MIRITRNQKHLLHIETSPEHVGDLTASHTNTGPIYLVCSSAFAAKLTWLARHTPKGTNPYGECVVRRFPILAKHFVSFSFGEITEIPL